MKIRELKYDFNVEKVTISQIKVIVPHDSRLPIK